MDKYRIDDFLNMTWLRPENVVWDARASSLIGDELVHTNQNILDIGIGNGYFSFMTLGGKFKKEYDWYYNVNTEGFLDNEDIYNTLKIKNIKDFIEKPAIKQVSLAIDHKDSLLEQVKQLNFVDRTLVHDANKNIDFSDMNIDIVYSNILYWLDKPIEVLKNIDNQLKKGSKVILVFPNENFYKFARSYNKESKIWTLLNRGRADSIMWRMNIGDFEKKLQQETSFKIEKFQIYLSEFNIKCWDIGFRPFSSPLIKMANSLNPSFRLEIKDEWVETAKPFVNHIMEDELLNGDKNGVFNFVVLRK